MTPVRIDLGNPTDNPTILCSQDWYLPTENPPWNFRIIRKLPPVTGPWMRTVRFRGDTNMAGLSFSSDGRSLAWAGADAKIGLKSGLNIDLTVNTDFAQVEADVESVSEEQGIARVHVGRHVLGVDLGHLRVGHQHHHDASVPDMDADGRRLDRSSEG